MQRPESEKSVESGNPSKGLWAPRRCTGCEFGTRHQNNNISERRPLYRVNVRPPQQERIKRAGRHVCASTFTEWTPSNAKSFIICADRYMHRVGYAMMDLLSDNRKNRCWIHLPHDCAVSLFSESESSSWILHCEDMDSKQTRRFQRLSNICLQASRRGALRARLQRH
jgi:hypothetical protein